MLPAWIILKTNIIFGTVVHNSGKYVFVIECFEKRVPIHLIPVSGCFQAVAFLTPGRNKAHVFGQHSICLPVLIFLSTISQTHSSHRQKPLWLMRSFLIFKAIWGQSRAENCQLGRGSSRHKGCRAVGSEINKILNDLPFVSAVVWVGSRANVHILHAASSRNISTGNRGHCTSDEQFNIPVKLNKTQSSFVELTIKNKPIA